MYGCDRAKIVIENLNLKIQLFGWKKCCRNIYAFRKKMGSESKIGDDDAIIMIVAS